MEKFNREKTYELGDKFIYEGKVVETKSSDSCCDCIFEYKLSECPRCPVGRSIYYVYTNESVEEERNITLTLNEAKVWYNEGGFKRELALKVFSKDELSPELTYSRILNSSIFSTKSIERLRSNVTLINKLARIANYFNPKGWKKNVEESGYFIVKEDTNPLVNGCRIVNHTSVVYPVIYFKEKDHAIQAAKMLSKEEVEYLVY